DRLLLEKGVEELGHERDARAAREDPSLLEAQIEAVEGVEALRVVRGNRLAFEEARVRLARVRIEPPARAPRLPQIERERDVEDVGSVELARDRRPVAEKTWLHALRTRQRVRDHSGDALVEGASQRELEAVRAPAHAR